MPPARPPALLDAFAYQAGRLHAEGVPLSKIADAAGTPCWVYSHGALESRYRAFDAAFAGIPHLICYALKANSNQAVIKTFADLGAGADIVSEGELRRALAAGVPPERIVFAGVGKTAAEMAVALDAGILQFNVESDQELERLSQVASQMGRTAGVALRVNPDVDAGTHAKITTGTAENKFGIEIDQARAVAARTAALPGLKLSGIAMHIGSQLTSVEPYRQAFARLVDFARMLMNEDGHKLERLDLGGGLGVHYQHAPPVDLASYCAAAREALAGFPGTVVLEPGRWMVADAGILLARVQYVKRGSLKTFVILDAAMNDLIRPALYDAWHPVIPVVEPAAGHGLETVDVVGPICESSDVIATGRSMPPVAQGELVAIGVAGAYGAVMASTYNSRPLAPEVMVKGGAFSVVRSRPSYDEMIASDRLAPWQIHRT
ncbi:diaminopimelate decarboxylase [Stella humosa]|uniref:Diaminopimelate decarboxylase n=1 Tax=Stella humosa TaxID=94 RepID=A0A3N1LJ81_9PROT|nr:diaminopimelate decarboxylase [Stella humosa]ROP91370.1 diaminopimelate decarboxylase [Stella humosa]